MKVYVHLNPQGFSNSYLVVNEKTNDALLIDPGHVTEPLITQLEENRYLLAAILVTHNHGSHVQGLKTLSKIYAPKIYGADWDIAGDRTNVISGDGKIRVAGLSVRYIMLPGHTTDSMVYKIENVLFTGDSISSGLLGSTNSSYSSQILRVNIEEKIFSEQDATVIFPGHGPPTTVGAEKLFNSGMLKKPEENRSSFSDFTRWTEHSYL
ncbi:MAG: MBL fold metallo-hydrolase [Treponema sp.]